MRILGADEKNEDKQHLTRSNLLLRIRAKVGHSVEELPTGGKLIPKNYTLQYNYSKVLRLAETQQQLSSILHTGRKL